MAAGSWLNIGSSLPRFTTPVSLDRLPVLLAGMVQELLERKELAERKEALERHGE